MLGTQVESKYSTFQQQESVEIKPFLLENIKTLDEARKEYAKLQQDMNVLIAMGKDGCSDERADYFKNKYQLREGNEEVKQQLNVARDESSALLEKAKIKDELEKLKTKKQVQEKLWNESYTELEIYQNQLKRLRLDDVRYKGLYDQYNLVLERVKDQHNACEVTDLRIKIHNNQLTQVSQTLLHIARDKKIKDKKNTRVSAQLNELVSLRMTQLTAKMKKLPDPDHQKKIALEKQLATGGFAFLAKKEPLQDPGLQRLAEDGHYGRSFEISKPKRS